jgi:hypothetical protein
MTVQHKDLTGNDLHESKGVSSAGAGTMETADGVGGSGWQKLATQSLEGVTSDGTAGQVVSVDGAGGFTIIEPGGATFGEMKIIDNSTPIALTAGSLSTDGDYVKVDTGIWVTGETDGVTFNSSGYLEVVTAGLYEISAWGCVSISAVGTNLVGIKYSVDDTNASLSPRKITRQSNNANDIGSIAASGFMTLSAGAKVSLWVVCDTNTNFTMLDGGLTLTLLKAT